MVSSSSSASNKYEGTASLSLECSWKMISVVSELWKSSRSLDSKSVVESVSCQRARLLDWRTPWLIALALSAWKKKVQDRVQVEEGREEQAVGETHEKEPDEEQRV